LLERARHRPPRGCARPARPRGRGRVPLDRRLPVLALRADLRRHQRDPAQHRRRADPRPASRAEGEPWAERAEGEPWAERAEGEQCAERGASVKFELTGEQRDFAASLDALLTSADTIAVARSWAAGDHAPGLKLWARLADQGVPALLVPEEYDGAG